MKNKQIVFVQLLAFFTAALSVIFLRQYQTGKSQQRIHHNGTASFPLTQNDEILLETAEVSLTEEIQIIPLTM